MKSKFAMIVQQRDIGEKQHHSISILIIIFFCDFTMATLILSVLTCFALKSLS